MELDERPLYFDSRPTCRVGSTGRRGSATADHVGQQSARNGRWTGCLRLATIARISKGAGGNNVTSVIFRFLVGLLVIVGCRIVGATPSTEDRSIVYSESYVWYLADRLANTAMSRVFTQPPAPDVAHQYQFELALLYHHGLIACDGPLDRIADAVKFSPLAMFKNNASVHLDDILNALGKTDGLVQPILEEWNAAVFPEISRVFRAGKATTVFPKCLNPRYGILRPQ